MSHTDIFGVGGQPSTVVVSERKTSARNLGSNVIEHFFYRIIIIVITPTQDLPVATTATTTKRIDRVEQGARIAFNMIVMN